MNDRGRRRLFLVIPLFAMALVICSLVGHQPRRASAETTAPAREPTQRDVTSCTSDSVPLVMDLYVPRADGLSNRQPLPAAIFVHGGSWSSGDKASSEGAL